MDAPAIVLYCAQSVRHDRIPFISDIHAFSTVVNTLSAGGYSALVILFFILDFLLLLSFIASAWCFFARNLYARRLALYQKYCVWLDFATQFPFFPGVKFHGRDECLAKWLFVLFVRVSENLFLWIYKYEGNGPRLKSKTANNQNIHV